MARASAARLRTSGGPHKSSRRASGPPRNVAPEIGDRRSPPCRVLDHSKYQGYSFGSASLPGGAGGRSFECNVTRNPLQPTEHVERARPVDPLDALELDVGGRRRAGDERDRPPRPARPRRAARRRRARRRRPAPRRSRRGGSRARASARAGPSCPPPSSTIVPVSAIPSAQPVSTPSRPSRSRDRQRRFVAHELDARDVRRRLGRNREPRRPALAARLGQRVGEPAAGDAVDGRAVVRDALAEQLDVGGGGAGRAVVARRRRAPTGVSPSAERMRPRTSARASLTPPLPERLRRGSRAARASRSSPQHRQRLGAERAAPELREAAAPARSACGEANTLRRPRPSPAARARSATSPRSRRARAGGSAPTGCRS